MAIIMKKINEDGVEIVKEVEDALYTQYITLGWTEVKKEKKQALQGLVSRKQCPTKTIVSVHLAPVFCTGLIYDDSLNR